MDPEQAPALRRLPILVEVHDHVDASLPRTLIGRFEESHAVEIIKSRSRRHADLTSFGSCPGASGARRSTSTAPVK
ncbi:MAG: hypothetical protein WAM90_01430 [Rhodanobacter sp.]